MVAGEEGYGRDGYCAEQLSDFAMRVTGWLGMGVFCLKKDDWPRASKKPKSRKCLVTSFLRVGVLYPH